MLSSTRLTGFNDTTSRSGSFTRYLPLESTHSTTVAQVPFSSGRPCKPVIRTPRPVGIRMRNFAYRRNSEPRSVYNGAVLAPLRRRVNTNDEPGGDHIPAATLSLFTLPRQQTWAARSHGRRQRHGTAMGPAAGLEVAGYLDEWAARIDGKIHQQGGQIRLSSLGGIPLPVVLRGRVAFAEALEQCGFQRAGGPGPLHMVTARSLAARVDRALPSGGNSGGSTAQSCSFFAQGRCRNGNTCRFSHASKQRQRRAATSHPAMHTLSSAVNKRARPTTMAARARSHEAGHVERRYDTDGGLYTKAEFVGEYGGAAEWGAAKRQPASVARMQVVPSPAASQGRYGGHGGDTKEVERRQQRASRFEAVSSRHQRAPSKWQEQLRQSQPPPLTALKELEPKTAGHVRYLNTLQDAAVTVVVAIGPAGTGKTSQAVLEGLRLLKAGAVSRLLLTRPDFLVQGRDEGGEAYLRRLDTHVMTNIWKVRY